MAKKNSSGHNHPKTTTLDLVNEYLRLKINKLNPIKRPMANQEISLVDSLPKAEINHIAIVLDGKVQEIIRAQNRLAALLLSEPTFVDFDPAKDSVAINDSYVDGKFIKDTTEE